MTVLLAVAGWCVAALLALELRRRAGLLADAAHELRGPLTAISLGLEVLRRQPAARRRADALAVELLRMNAAADDVAAAARGRRARAAARTVPVRELLERCGDAWRPAAERRGGRLAFDWPTGRDAAVRGDRARLAQAFGNLLANAVEHGGGDVVVRGRPVDGGVRVEIESAGVAPRGTAPAGREARSGRGRGLEIAARGIAQSGGRLEARPRHGGGRLTVAELPLDRSP